MALAGESEASCDPSDAFASRVLLSGRETRAPMADKMTTARPTVPRNRRLRLLLCSELVQRGWALSETGTARYPERKGNRKLDIGVKAEGEVERTSASKCR